jgi:acetylserotonin N-methyltransferase
MSQKRKALTVVQDTSKPDPSMVLDLILAFRRSKTMFAAVSLGVFDVLISGPKSVASLAKTLKLNADALERLLDACVGLQLLKHGKGGYETTPIAATYLSSESPFRITGYINFSNRFFWKLWENLEDAIREGTNRWKQAFGWDGPYWDSIFKTPDQQREFLMGMHGYGEITSPHVVSAFDLSAFKTLVDLGGGTGHLAIAACRLYSELKAKVFDLPTILPLAREVIAARETKVAKRIEVIGGDFFKGPLPKGDLYVVARTLHDWPESRVVELMQKVFNALPRDGALLIAEKILKEDKTGPDWAQMQNLNMLAITEGKERTFTEYDTLLRKCGFRSVTPRATRSPLDVILASRNVDRDRVITGIPTIRVRETRRKEPIDVWKQFQLLYTFFEQSPIGFVISDMDGKFMLVNQAYADIHGRTVEETLQLNYKEFTPKAYYDEDECQIAALKKNGHVGPFEKEYIRRDGSLVRIWLSLHLVKIENRPYIWSIVEQIAGQDLFQKRPSL